MADRIGPSDDKQRASKIQRPAGEKKVETKTTKGPTVPEISKTSGIPQETPHIDPANPSLIRPNAKMFVSSDKEAVDIEKSLTNKLTLPRPYNEVAQIVAQKSKSSYAAMYEIQILLAVAQKSQIDITGDIMEAYGRKQIEQQEKSSKTMLEQIKAEQKFANAGIASKILAWFGDVVNLIAAAVAVVGAGLSALATGGAAAPVLIAATLWLTGAVIGIAGHALDEAGTLKDAKLEWLGIVLTVTSTVLSIGGYAITGGASATLQAGEGTLKTLRYAVMGFEKGMPLLKAVAEPTAQITQAVYSFKVSGLQMDKIKQEKELNQIDFVIDQTSKGIANMLKTLNEHQLKTVSVDMRERFRTISAILGNI